MYYYCEIKIACRNRFGFIPRPGRRNIIINCCYVNNSIFRKWRRRSPRCRQRSVTRAGTGARGSLRWEGPRSAPRLTRIISVPSPGRGETATRGSETSSCWVLDNDIPESKPRWVQTRARHAQTSVPV